MSARKGLYVIACTLQSTIKIIFCLPTTTSSTELRISGGLNELKDRSHLNILLSLGTMLDIRKVICPTFPDNDPMKLILLTE